ncbi:hypothetical protein [Moritella sp. Urea-trap-13]|uniref:hypothetical protein n=1 Tax=Moritella sp. Urea-trap-13 TaxID=2058327 RepID=UPI000C31E2FB|nr:hypothetical protein [Moritella sp. Urea-trap-13]PKH07890.1 hypothetical protein CXF93_04140 [Moritella sp. Urea-trap-13]
MINKMKLLGLALVTVVMSGCATVQLPAAQQELIDNNTTLYTQVGMWTEKGNVIATNYKRGEHIPVNSVVQITDVDASTVTFNYDGRSIKLKNIEKFTKVDVPALMTRTFALEQVNLTQFSALEKTAIEQGDVVIGMTKDAVIISRGFPPAHRTASLKLDSWRFWQNRFGTIVYEFEQGKVSKVIK